MARDVRNLILDRLSDLVRVSGVSSSARNAAQGFSDGAALPGVIVFDGSEVSEPAPRNAPGKMIYRVTMEPYVQVVTQGDDAVVGDDLAKLRLAIVKAVLFDETLAALSAEGSGVRYLGAMTKFTPGRGVQGDMVIRFSILYYLRPNDL